VRGPEFKLKHCKKKKCNGRSEIGLNISNLEHLRTGIWDTQLPITYMIPEFTREMEAED
jgi:hypothetical protein